MPLDTVIDKARLEAGLTATADAIRAKTGDSEPIPWNTDTGFAEAVENMKSGGTVELQITNARYLFTNEARLDCMDKLISLISPTCDDFENMFASCVNMTTAPYVDTSNSRILRGMFSYCTKLTAIPEIDVSSAVTLESMFMCCQNLTEVHYLNTSNNNYCKGMFQQCSSMVTAPEMDMSKCFTTQQMFNYCNNLTTVPALSLKRCNNVSSMFTGCAKLTNLYLYDIKTSIQIGSGTTWGHLLTVDSLVHTIKELRKATSTRTLTMGSANLEKISGLYCRITDDTNEKLTMELCESTDEGAMTLADYAAEKGWVFK